MIKKNKWLNVSITAALAVGVLAGCASNDGKNNTNQTAGDDKKQEPITLTWFDSNTKENLSLMLLRRKSPKNRHFDLNPAANG